jgi:hypothetical protein
MNDNTNVVPSHTVEEMKSAVIKYGQINNEIKQLQKTLKHLRQQRDFLSEQMKQFMKFNQLEMCHISDSFNTDIRKVRYVQKDKKQRITLKIIEEYFAHFFNDIDVSKFMELSNKEKSEAFFDYLERQRPCTTLDCILIR